MLSPNEFNKLIDDLKIFARLHKIVRDESNDEKRKYASLIVEDMYTRFINDLTEMKQKN
jgi:hypothetical protein